MTIRNYKLGPGTLTLNPGAAFEMNTQLKNARVEWSENVSSEDAVDVLSGEQLAGDEDASYTAKLAGNVLQDLEDTGLVAFTWENMGLEVPFTFTPRTDVGTAVSGTVRIVPLNLGGDVKSRPESDFSWSCVGDLPELAFAP